MPVDLTSPQTYLYVIMAGLILVLPGTAIYLLAHQLHGSLSHARPDRPDLADALLCSPALAVAFWPLMLLYLTLVGLSLTLPLLIVMLTASALCIVGVLFKGQRPVGHRVAPAHMRMEAGYSNPHSGAWPGRVRLTHGAALALSGMLALALAFRLADVQGLVVPMFGDSLHHTMIASLIANSGQVPSGYAPYVPVNTFTYHFGFHTLAAILNLLTGAPLPHAVLITGQILIVTALSVAGLLNRGMFHSWYAGLGAALLTGFASLMPAYYVNWGRYTQLAGNVLLVVALTLLVQTMGPRWTRASAALAALCVAGLVVVHYRILIFFGLFGLALAVAQLLTAWWAGRSFRDVGAAWVRGLLVVAGGMVVALPWLLNLWANYFPVLVGRLQTVTPDYLAVYNNPQSIAYFVGRFLPVMAALGLTLCMAPRAVMAVKGRRNPAPATGEGADQAHLQSERETSGMALAVWTALLVLSLWIVPGAIGSYTVAITLYIPLSALGGYALGWAMEKLVTATAGVGAGRKAMPQALTLTLALALGTVALAGAFSVASGTWHLIDPGRYQYVHAPDLQAFQWIRDNTPPTARFLISSEFSYAGRGVTATDAGMWLPLLTGRNVSVPALSAWMERPADPEFFTATRTLAAYTQPLAAPQPEGISTQQALRQAGVISSTHTLSDPETLALMRFLGITHVYVGVALGNSKPRLDVAAMRRDSRHYRLVYSEQGVYVFEVIYQVEGITGEPAHAVRARCDPTPPDRRFCLSEFFCRWPACGLLRLPTLG